MLVDNEFVCSPLLYSKPRQIVVQFDGNLSGYAVFNQIRLKRKNNYVAPPNNVVPAHAAVYSCYLVIISTMICVEMQKLAETLASAKAVVPSTQFLVQEYSHGSAPQKTLDDGHHGVAAVGSRDRQDSGDKSFNAGMAPAALLGTPEKSEAGSGNAALSHSTVRGRSASRAMSMSMMTTPSKYDMNKYHDDYQATAKACKLALRVSFPYFLNGFLKMSLCVVGCV